MNTDPVVLVPSSVPDPMVQNRTQVNFEITVPVYQSNALQVRLFWGDIGMTARWVGDELWSVSTDLPTNTEHALLVTFYDNNGALELAGFEQTYRTGTNASETYTVTVDQFNTDRFDTDEDGSNNLDELIAGTDPLVNETEALEIRDSYNVGSIFLVSAYHEQSITDERPFSHKLEELPPVDASFNSVRRSHLVTIEIDELGNGIVSDQYQYRDIRDSDITTENQEGTRNKTENSVLWNGTYNRINSGSQVSDDIEFSTETWIISDQTIKQNGTVQRELKGRGALDYEQELSYSLIGKRLDDSDRCMPVSGTVTNKLSYRRRPAGSDELIVVTKESDDTFWSVRLTSHVGELIEEYLTKSLGANFYCEFSDL